MIDQQILNIRYYNFFPEDNVEDTRTGKFELTLDVDVLERNLSRVIDGAQESICKFKNMKETRRIKYDELRAGLEKIRARFEEKANAIYQNGSYRVGENEYADRLYNKFLVAAETIGRLSNATKVYEMPIIKAAENKPVQGILGKIGSKIGGWLWGRKPVLQNS